MRNIFVYLVLRVSIDYGARALSDSSPAPQVLHSSLLVDSSFSFLWPHKRHLTKSPLPTSSAGLCLLGLLHRNQRQPSQLHEDVLPHTPIGYGHRFSAACTSGNLEESQDRLLRLLHSGDRNKVSRVKNFGIMAWIYAKHLGLRLLHWYQLRVGRLPLSR